MRRGCISQGNIKCDSCGQIVPYAGRYMTVEEVDGAESSEGGETKNYCVNVVLKRSMPNTVKKKGRRF